MDSDSSKSNLLIVASSLWIGGAEMVIRSLALTLDRRRFNVTVCHLKAVNPWKIFIRVGADCDRDHICCHRALDQVLREL